MAWSWHWFTGLSALDWETVKHMNNWIWTVYFPSGHGLGLIWTGFWSFIGSFLGTIGIFFWWFIIHFAWPIVVAIVTFLAACVLAVLWFLALIVWLVVWKMTFCLLLTTVWNMVAWFLIDFLWAGAVWLWPYILVLAKWVVIIVMIPAFASVLLEATKKKNELVYILSWLGWTTLLVTNLPIWLVVTMLISTVLYYNSDDLQKSSPQDAHS